MQRQQPVESKEVKASSPSIHYIWIGEPSGIEDKNYGHDIIGLLEMATVNHPNREGPWNPIFFWCLPAYIPYYQECFKKYNHVQVSNIIELVNTIAANSSHPLQRQAIEIKKIIPELLAREHITTRHYVTLKDMLSLFLLATQKNCYALDTNVFPTHCTYLPFNESFRAPCISSNPQQMSDAECWAFGTPDNHQIPAKMLDNYLREFAEAENNLKLKKHDRDTALQIYARTLAIAIIQPIYQGIKEKEIIPWIYNDDENFLEELGVKKFYNNTHRSDIPLSALFLSILTENYEMIRILAAWGVNFNTPAEEGIRLALSSGQTFEVEEKDTPLDLAHKKNPGQLTKELLKGGAKLASTATVTSFFENHAVTVTVNAKTDDRGFIEPPPVEGKSNKGNTQKHVISLRDLRNTTIASATRATHIARYSTFSAHAKLTALSHPSTSFEEKGVASDAKASPRPQSEPEEPAFQPSKKK